MDRSLIYFLGPLLTDLTGQTDRQYWIWNQSIRTLHCSEILINAMVSLIWTSFLKSWSKKINEWLANWPAILNLNYNISDQIKICNLSIWTSFCSEIDFNANGLLKGPIDQQSWIWIMSLTYFLVPYIVHRYQTDRQSSIWNQSIWTFFYSEILIKYDFRIII